MAGQSGWTIVARGLRNAFIVACAIALIFALSAESCGSSDNDVKVKTRDTTGATILNMPDQFPSVAVKCDGKGHRVYVTNRYDNGAGGAVTAVDDSTCRHVGP